MPDPPGNKPSVPKQRKAPRAPRGTVTVTQAVIAESTRRDSSHCMIAEAVKAAFPLAANVAVDLQTIRFSYRTKRQRYIYLTPRVAQVALIDFDKGDKPQPFSFRLRGAQLVPIQDRPPLERLHRSEKRAVLRAAQAKAKLTRQDNGVVPDKIGGLAPPSTSFARRRAFGLRALDR